MKDLEKIKLEKDIDLAAFRYWSDSFDVESGRENGSESSFRDGALSPEAKAYWFKQFQEDKIIEIMKDDETSRLYDPIYTEKEVKELIHKFHIVTDGTLKFEDEWFEQNKKK